MSVPKRPKPRPSGPPPGWKREVQLVKLLREMRDVMREDLIAAGGEQLKLQPELRRRVRLLKRVNAALGPGIA